MSQKVKYISRMRDEFDATVCGVNGVILRSRNIDVAAIDALIKMYQSGKKVMLASNMSFRVHELFGRLKSAGVPMNIFYAMITAGEMTHFYLQQATELGKCYYFLGESPSKIMRGLSYRETSLLDNADFMLAENNDEGIDTDFYLPLLEQGVRRQLPLVCVGNNTSLMTDGGVRAGAGALAEQYALMGGKIIPFGKPDVRIAAYLTEGISDLKRSRCLVVGNCMATDMRMGNGFKAKTMLLTGGVHQLNDAQPEQIDVLSANYGLHVDYYTEALQW